MCPIDTLVTRWCITPGTFPIHAFPVVLRGALKQCFVGRQPTIIQNLYPMNGTLSTPQERPLYGRNVTIKKLIIKHTKNILSKPSSSGPFSPQQTKSPSRYLKKQDKNQSCIFQEKVIVVAFRKKSLLIFNKRMRSFCFDSWEIVKRVLWARDSLLFET